MGDDISNFKPTKKFNNLVEDITLVNIYEPNTGNNFC